MYLYLSCVAALLFAPHLPPFPSPPPHPLLPSFPFICLSHLPSLPSSSPLQTPLQLPPNGNLARHLVVDCLMTQKRKKKVASSLRPLNQLLPLPQRNARRYMTSHTQNLRLKQCIIQQLSHRRHPPPPPPPPLLPSLSFCLSLLISSRLFHSEASGWGIRIWRCPTLFPDRVHPKHLQPRRKEPKGDRPHDCDWLTNRFSWT